jgi:hypothetical protein
MKTFGLLLLVVLMAGSSCTKPAIKTMTVAAPLNFEIIGKDGKSMVTSKKDSITISYTENGETKLFRPSIMKLQVSETDTTSVSKYNGLCINDNTVMSALSSRPSSPIRTFNLNLNGENLGVIYVDYWRYQAAYPQLSSPALTFNNVQVISDRSPYPVDGSDINLLQVQ